MILEFVRITSIMTDKLWYTTIINWKWIIVILLTNDTNSTTTQQRHLAKKR